MAAAPASLPNVVVILADDLGYGDVRALNPARGKIPTPHLDRLAAEGLSFLDAHSGSAVCTPTRYGLLTGRYAWRTRLEKGVLDGFVAPLIAADRLTLPGLLRAHGYHTAVIGKWHLGFTLEDGSTLAAQTPGAAGPRPGTRTPDGPITRGFDAFYGVQHARSMGTLFAQDRADETTAPVAVLEKLTQRATAYIETRAKSNQPFFLYFAQTSPHTPIVPSRPWQGRSGLGEYGDFVMETDDSVGQVLAALERAGIAERTLVVFTSDNGFSPQAGTAALEQLGHFPSAGFRGYKTDIWEGGHRVPFLVRWPGRVPAGRTTDALICLNDLMATLAALVGAPLPANAAEDSVSFLPVLRDPAAPGRTELVHHSIDGSFALRSGAWKLAFTSGSGGWSPGETGAPLQLYHLAADPAEKENLAAREPAVVAGLTARLAEIIRAGRSTPGPAARNDRAVPLPGN